MESFKNRHNIVWYQICGESNSVDVQNVDEWKVKLKLIIEGYEPKNIYNGDETGLFFRALPSKTLSVKSEECKGGKLSKERLTVFLCANMEGEFENSLVIVKAQKPRCFKNVDLTKFPVIWRANNKAWMTGSILEDWLHTFNNKFEKQNRRVILFLDNATCHPHLNLSNVRLALLPANTTSLNQPMDQGIIYSIKVNYLKMVLQSLLANTVKKCYIKTGFNLVLDQPTDAINDNDNEFKLLCSTINEKVDSDEYVNIDKHLCTYDTVIINNTTVKPCTSIDVEQSSSEDETFNVPLHGNDIKTYKNALHEIKRLEMFALDQNNENELLESILNLKNLVVKKMASQVRKQKTLDDYGDENVVKDRFAEYSNNLNDGDHIDVLSLHRDDPLEHSNKSKRDEVMENEFESISKDSNEHREHEQGNGHMSKCTTFAR
ncbi:tigger transposable element-derived protein 6-like [Myzus persicae]|uniref:tigger transposable element-derived protein 6-like n=1 Tax=Myzus persicae TaxID=13164 RepID=UPI000B93011B|nr:tigger transposable element-derived protein 6-like [Myzus persicae]